MQSLKKARSGYFAMVGLALLAIFAVILPHTGLLAHMGRDLFVDEALFIDSAVSLIRRGWVTTRGSALAFDPFVTSGVLGSLLPGAAALTTESYAWGRLVSGLQNAVALGSVAYLTSLWTGSRAAGALFLGAALLVPAIPATLVYSQAELLCFATIVWAIHMFADRGRPILAGVLFGLAIHLKLVAVVAIMGALGSTLLWRVVSGRRGHIVRDIPRAMAGIAAVFLVWHAFQFAATPTMDGYRASWKMFFEIFQGAGSGLRGDAISRWDLLTTPAGEIGGMSLAGKAVVLTLIAAGLLGPLLALRPSARERSGQGTALALVMIAGAQFAHIAWWLLKADNAWVRHGFVGLLLGGIWAAWLGAHTLEFLRLKPQWIRTIPLVFLVAVALAKSFSGWRELKGHTPGCSTFAQPVFCRIGQSDVLIYRAWVQVRP